MRIYYENCKGEIVYLDQPPYYMLDTSDVVDYEWDYTCNKTETAISMFKKYMKQKSIDIAIVSNSINQHRKDINYLIDTTEMDVLTVNPGKLYIGEYYISCYFVKNKKGRRYIDAKKTSMNFTMIVEKDIWIREEFMKYRYADLPHDTSGRGYSYDYAYDYKSSGGYTAVFANANTGYGHCVITIYGYANCPYVVIGSNIYQLNYVVQTGEKAVIDTETKRIYLVKKNGVVVNLFRYRGDHYIFEKIPPGEQIIYWNGNYDIDILLKTERSEPKWM